jgi:nitroreductase
MMLYTIKNGAFGSINYAMLTQDVKMPADVNDVDLLTGLKAARTAPSTSTSRPTKMAYLLLDVQLHRIASKINEHVSSYQHTVRFDTGKLEAKVTSVREMCDARYQSDTEQPLAIHHQANLHILYSQIH